MPADAAAVRVLHASDSLFAAGRLDSAVSVCAALERRARAAHDRNTLLECRLRQAAGSIAGNQIASGEAAAREGLALAEGLRDSANVRRALRWLGYSFLRRTRLEEARPYYQRLLALAAPLRDYENEGMARGSLAYADLLAGRLRDAERGYRMACACLDSAHDVRAKMWNLVGLARVQGDLGDFPAARASYENIVRAAAASGALASQADAINNLGTLEYNVGDPARAESFWRRAVALYRESGDVGPRLSTETNLCIAENDLGRSDDAARQLESLAASAAAGGFRAQEASALDELAELRLGQGRPAEAGALFRRILGGTRPEEPGRVSLAIRGLARALAASGHVDQALDELMRGAAPLRPQLAATERIALDVQIGRLELACGHAARARERLAGAASAAEHDGLAADRLDAIVAEGECERALGHPAAALRLLREGQRLWESERRVPSDPDWRVQRGQLAEALCFDLAGLVLADRAGRDTTARLRDAYDLLQRFKARTLLERMAGPADVLPSGHDREPITLARVQSRVLKPGELLLDAFVGRRDALLFAVTRDSLRMVRLPDAASLAERVRILRELDTGDSAGAASALAAAVRVRAGRQLGRDLLGGVLDLTAQARRIIFAADGALIALPFESLPVSLAPGAPESALVAAREVTRVPSVSLLTTLRSWDPSDQAGRLLASASNDRGGQLPAALAEARWLSRRYAGSEVRLAGGKGGAPMATADLARFEVLHFAAHARADDQRPWNSAVLVEVGDSSGTRHELTAASIAGTRLGARLVVLAGCESAGGRIVWGEGLEGLSAAFLTAGVPAVAATLWPVEDVAAAEFTRAFYRRLERGDCAAAALRAARVALASGPWAGSAAAFVLIGDGEVHVTLRRRFPGIPAGLTLLALVAVGLGLTRWRTGRPAASRARTL